MLVVGAAPTNPSIAADGTIIYNANTANFSGRINGQWVPLIAGVKPVYGVIPSASGTTSITSANSLPTILMGTQILSVDYTPLFAKSVIEFKLSFLADLSQSGYLTCLVFRGSTMIGMAVTSIDQYTSLLGTSSNTPTVFAMDLFDQPNTTSKVTYTVRLGSSVGTWYVNQSMSFTFGGGAAYPGNYSIREHF